MKHKELRYQTVKPILRSTLERLMRIDEFRPFRLVGGTSLSLRYGHRISDDIDLFTDAEYGSIDSPKGACLGFKV
ncbi:MAG: nucleotidyl transferase AbiEii/AbiGii toxin family protein [Muribaculaceae bacterium]|nr:nucleotidyl transferase AbiEii/AbiGii toxin family protein [Muribaculaceae bacterium]